MKMQISFYFLKNSDLPLMKMQINFYFEKFRFTSNEDANQFLISEKIQIYIWWRCKSVFVLKKIQICI